MIEQMTTGRFLMACCLLVSVVYRSPVYAQAPRGSDRLLEEVIVTAQKREQVLQDVPISIVVMEGETLRQNNVQDLHDLSISVPNLWISQSFTQGYMSIRGVSSGVNPGFESTVGMVIDGFFYPRNSFSRLALLDVDRVEVLRGPQGAIIGKNTTAGAINITTAKPTNEFAGWSQLTGEVEGDVGYTAEGALSMPFTETIKGRLAIQYDNREGYLENSFTGEDTPERDDLYARGTLLWEPHDDLSVTAKYSVVDLHADGRPIELISCDQPLIDNVLVAAGRSGFEDCTLNFVTSADFGRPPLGPGQFDDQDTEVEIADLTIEWNTPLGTVTSLTGFADSEHAGEQSGFSTALPGRSVDFGEDYEQFSQEARLTSTRDAPLDYIFGLYYLHTEQSSLTAINLHVPPPFLPFPASINILADQESDAIAGFGQLTWHVNDQFQLTVDGRYTYEEKEADLFSTVSALFNPSRVFLPLYDISLDRTENNFSPGLNVSWMPGNDKHFYASVRRGFKGGGYNHFLQANSDAEALLLAEFEEEEVTAFELGTKLTFAGGAGYFSAALFRSEFDDLQVTANVQEGILAAFTVTNAATATSQGVELEARWRPTDVLTVGMKAAYLDAEYDSFPNSSCEQPKDASVGCFPSPVTGQPIKDLSGEPLPFAPEWSFSVDGQYIWPLAGGWDLIVTGELVYNSEYFTEFLLDAESLQDNWSKINAGLGIANESWRLQIVGRNLTDEKTFFAGGDIPISMGKSANGIPDPPRTIAVQVAYTF